MEQNWNLLGTDDERWDYLRNSFWGDSIVVMLDNDWTGARVDDYFDPEQEFDLKSFDEPIGQSPGLYTLLESLGISFENV